MKLTAWSQSLLSSVLLALLAICSPADAGVIYSELDITGPILAFGSAGQAVAAGTSGSYSFSGEFCENTYCSSGAIGTATDSLLRLTNLTLTCNLGSGTCSPIDIVYEALGGSGSGPLVSIAISLSGTGTASGFARICIQDSNSLCDSNLNGAKSFSFGFSGGISGSASGTGNVASGYDVFGILHLNGLSANTSINLVNSLDIGLTGLSDGAVPEPATAGLFLVGFGVAWTLRRRLKARLPG